MPDDRPNLAAAQKTEDVLPQPSIKEHVTTSRMLISITIVVILSLLAWLVKNASKGLDYYWFALAGWLSSLVALGLEFKLYNRLVVELDTEAAKRASKCLEPAPEATKE